jgi:hypothetical protein
VLRDVPIPEGLDRAEFHTACLSTVKQLIATGFLFRPAPSATPARVTSFEASTP